MVTHSVFGNPTINNLAILLRWDLAAQEDEAWDLNGMAEDMWELADGGTVDFVDRHPWLVFRYWKVPRLLEFL
jgi:hypothetical protein